MEESPSCFSVDTSLVREVEIDSFYIDSYPVLQIEWIQVMNSNPSNNCNELNPDWPSPCAKHSSLKD